MKCDCDVKMQLVDFEFLLWHIQHIKQFHPEAFSMIKELVNKDGL